MSMRKMISQNHYDKLTETQKSIVDNLVIALSENKLYSPFSVIGLASVLYGNSKFGKMTLNNTNDALKFWVKQRGLS